MSHYISSKKQYVIILRAMKSQKLRESTAFVLFELNEFGHRSSGSARK
jgi:hypothetical protein